jgi:hypothetical protein
VTNAGHRIGDCARHSGRTFAISFQQVKCDSLRRLATDARHTAQRID